MKKYIAILSVALVMMAGVFLLSEESDESSALTDGDWTFTANGTQATITSFSGSGVSSLEVPSTVTSGGVTYTVTSLQGTGTSSIVKNNALSSHCTLVLPSTLTTIGSNAFNSIIRLNGDLTIPDSVTTIGANAFKGCRGFTGTLTMSSNVTTIGDSAFDGCYGFTGSLTLPASLHSIGDSAFNGCRGLTGSLTIPSGVTSIGNSTFYGCSGFNALSLPSGVTSIGDSAFEACSGFNNSFTLPSSVTTIGAKAFFGCTKLKSTVMTISDSVTSIGTGAFAQCRAISSFDVSATNPNYKSVDGVLFSKNGATLMQCPGGKYGTYSIPNGVTVISDYAFHGCLGVNEFGSWTIPDSVTIIGEYAFYATQATSLTLGNSITSIGGWAFYTALIGGQIVFPDTLTTLGRYAFYGCYALTGSLTIPDSITSIGDNTFNGCTQLSGLLTLGDSVTTIDSTAFSSCSFTAVIIPDSVTTIYSGAFGECTSLATVYNASSIALVKGSSDNGCVAQYATDVYTCHTITLQSNDPTYGNVSDSKIYAIDGTAFTIDGANLSTSVPEQHVTATPNTDYTFSGWSDASGAVTSDRTVSAIFMAESVGYVITVLPNNSEYGSVSSATINVAPDSAIVTNGASLTVDGQSVTASPASATAQYTYAFSGWSPSSGTVTQDMTITANFTRTLNQYTVNISPNDNTFGTVNRSSVTVDYGTVMSVSGRVLTIGSVTVTATPANDTVQYAYSFTNWVGTGPVTGPMSVTAVFARDLQTYTVSITNSTPGWGTTDTDSLTVDYGATISADGNVLTVGTDDVVATPESATAQYSYSFGAWSPSSGTVTGDTAITVDFTRSVRTYTMSFQVDKPEYGAWSMDSLTVPYGTAVVADGTSVDVGGTVVEIILTPDSAVSTYKLISISGLPTTVTGDAPVTAELGRDNAMDAYNIIQPEYKEGEAKSGIAYDILTLLPVFVVIGLLIFAISKLGVFESIRNRY